MLLENLEEHLNEAGMDRGLTNNPAESMNATLKRWNDGKMSEIDELTNNLKGGVMAQYVELQRGHTDISQKFQFATNSRI